MIQGATLHIHRSPAAAVREHYHRFDEYLLDMGNGASYNANARIPVKTVNSARVPFAFRECFGPLGGPALRFDRYRRALARAHTMHTRNETHHWPNSRYQFHLFLRFLFANVAASCCNGLSSVIQWASLTVTVRSMMQQTMQCGEGFREVCTYICKRHVMKLVNLEFRMLLLYNKSLLYPLY